MKKDIEYKKEMLKHLPSEIVGARSAEGGPISYVTDKIHFSDYVCTSEESGLLYLAEHISALEKVTGKKHEIRPLQEKVSDWTEYYLSQGDDVIYLSSTCGCHDEFKPEKIDWEPFLLNGHVFYFVQTTGCGRTFDKIVGKKVLGREDAWVGDEDVLEWYKKDMDEKVKDLRKVYAKELVHWDLHHKMHIIPSHVVYTS